MLRRREVRRARALMGRFRAWRICRMGIVLVLSAGSRVSGSGRRDVARAQSECCFSKSVDVRRLTTMSSVIVALRPRSCWSGSRGGLPARLRLQAVAEGIVCCRRVVVVWFEGAQLGGPRRQWLDVKSWRSWRATRPHVSLWALEVAILAPLFKHGLGGGSRRSRGDSEVWCWAFGRGAPAPGRDGSSWNKSSMCSGEEHWRRRKQDSQVVRVSES